MDFSAIGKIGQSTRQVVWFGIVLALAFALKQYYSLTEAGGLAWILAPTARCVELVTGIPFVFEQGTGFVNLGHRAVIAPACAGINFMIIVFCMIGFSLVRRCKGEKTRLLVVPAALVSAYCLTVMVNSLRISLAIYSYDRDFHFGPLTQERIHQLEGTAVYFASLCIIYAVLMRLLRKKAAADRMKQESKAGVSAEKTWRLMAPAVWYLAVTLAVPIMLGKFSVYGRQLVEHTLFVLAIPALVIAVMASCRFFHGMLRDRRHGNGAVS